ITTDAWRNSLDHYQEFVIIVALDLKIEELKLVNLKAPYGMRPMSYAGKWTLLNIKIIYWG
ncbi:hypothetical protein, partial [Lacticaseibacillus paracasei]|uniref:hypothetical protein n=1 Tax=Lacticaseibacillus paracasei TaxID=1597 RepID=UPI0040460009